MNYTMNLRKELLAKSLEYCQDNHFPKQVFESALIFTNIKDNFHSDSYENIIKMPQYEVRLKKTHSHFKDKNIKELQSSASSDALLMNIFCHPKIQYEWKGIKKLLEINSIDSIEFGYYPNIERLDSMTKTEIDMKIDNILFEAKLTESNFTAKDYETLIDKYPRAKEIFNLNKLLNKKGEINNYQLIRNIIAAVEKDCRFILLIHSQRTDLIRNFYIVYDSIENELIKQKISFLTWQEITDVVGTDLKQFLKGKYGL